MLLDLDLGGIVRVRIAKDLKTHRDFVCPPQESKSSNPHSVMVNTSGDVI